MVERAYKPKRDEGVWVPSIVQGGYPATLRAYRAYHPAVRVHYVTHRGRTVWMTDKQYNVWCYVQAQHRRKRRLRLADIAKACACSKATVSRFLARLDLWRFLNLATMVGRRGGTWIYPRKATTRERDAWLAGARQSWATRKRARDLLVAKIRRQLREDEGRWRAAIRNVRATATDRARLVVRVQQLALDLPIGGGRLR